MWSIQIGEVKKLTLLNNLLGYNVQTIVILY